MDYIGGFKFHPRKRVSALPNVDWSGRPFPTELDEVYGSFSDEKARAMRACKSACKDLQGRKFRITSHNTFGFCVAFEFANPETGELMVATMTRCNWDCYLVD